MAAKEDDSPAVEGENPYTDPDQAESLLLTITALLAVGVGTAHGVYGIPHIEQGTSSRLSASI